MRQRQTRDRGNRDAADPDVRVMPDQDLQAAVSQGEVHRWMD
ncbi:hypothetical protein [Microvirga aerophila]|nr:hypothetical protein [Microvirga aerophila]